MKHNWSGWPGAFCLDCGAEHGLENAIGMEWYDPATDEWISDKHKELISLCDGYCPAKMTSEESEEIRKQAKEIQKQIKKE